MSQETELISELIKLTNEDQLEWRRPFLNINFAEKNGWRFYTEMPQDDRPLLNIHNPNGKTATVQAYGCGIEELATAILNQYQRFKLYEYSRQYQEELKEIEKKRLAHNKKMAEDLAELTKQFKTQSGS